MESLNQSQYNCKVGRDWREDGDPDVPVLRDVCATKLLNTPIHLGSQDVVKSKYRFKEMKGVSSHLLPSYLDERMWRDRWGCPNDHTTFFRLGSWVVVNKLSTTFWST